jgi:hypothetical protein
MLRNLVGAPSIGRAVRKHLALSSLLLPAAILLLHESSRIDAQDAKPIAVVTAEQPILDFTLRDFGDKPFALADTKRNNGASS